MRIAIGLLGILVLVGLIVPVDLVAQEWTRFRGPNGGGVSDATSIPVDFDRDDYNWVAELPGIGHSSPVIWGDRIFLMSANPETAKRYVLCISAESGDILWTREFDSDHHHLHGRNSFASGTPAVDEERLYVAWSDPSQVRLMAFDHDGNDVWERNLGTWVSQHGFGTSPIVYQDKLILFNSQQKDRVEGVPPGDSHMMAFDRESGDTRWSTPMNATRVCYSVPCIYQNEQGEDELIGCNTGNGIFSIDPDNGEMNWQIDLFRMRTVASPYIAGGLVFGSNGSGGGGNYIVGVKPARTRKRHFASPYRLTMFRHRLPLKICCSCFTTRES